MTPELQHRGARRDGVVAGEALAERMLCGCAQPGCPHRPFTVSMRVTHEEVAAFAESSGDRNPLHIDADYARRTAFGMPVVFGMLVVSRCLRAAALTREDGLVDLEIVFSGPVFAGVTYSLEVRSQDGWGICEVRDGVTVLVKLRIRRQPGGDAGVGAGHDGAAPQEGTNRALETVPRDHDEDTLARGLTLSGWYARSDRDGGSADRADEAILACCSYIAGMLLPGERALLSGARLRYTPLLTRGDGLWFEAKTLAFDRDFGLLRSSLRCHRSGRILVEGEIDAFVRPRVSTVTLQRVRDGLPASLSARGKVALVTGASRGLGAAILKTLGAMGYTVLLNFRSSAAEARAIESELSAAGAEIRLLRGDAGDPAWCDKTRSWIATSYGRLDAAVYNACEPPTAIGDGHDADRRRSEYIERNIGLTARPMEAFADLLDQSSGVSVLVSSTMAVRADAALDHYAEVKRRLEARLVHDCRVRQNTSFVIARPPPLRTDMGNAPWSARQAMPPEVVARAIGRAMAAAAPGAPRVVDRFDPEAHVRSAAAAEQRGTGVVVAANFTVDGIGASLRHWGALVGETFDVRIAPYNQIFQELLDPASASRRNINGLNLILVKTDAWMVAGSKQDNPPIERVRSVCDELEAALRQGARDAADATTLVIVCPRSLDARSRSAISDELDRVDAELVERLRAIPGVDAIQSRDSHALYGFDFQDDPVRHTLGDIPYAEPYYHFLGTLAVRRYCAASRPPFKVVVLDCDNTLWEGACGEVGSRGVGLGAPYRELQRFFVGKKEQGFLLCLCSKNLESDVWAVFDERKDMVLRRDDIVGHRINWAAKSENLRSLARELDLGLDSFVFVDDNPMECAEVRARCPEVLTLCTADATTPTVTELLAHVWAFDRLAVTELDRRRSELYQQDRLRRATRESCRSLAEFIEGLGLEVDVEPLDDDGWERAAQLTMRTNQFNASTRRRRAHELRALGDEPGWSCFGVRVRDRFGDYGLCGLIIERRQQAAVEVETLLLSCRVLGRGVESRVIADIARRAAQQGIDTIQIPYRETDRNEPARRFLQRLDPAPEVLEDGTLVFRGSTASVGALTFDELGGDAEDAMVRSPAPSKQAPSRVAQYVAIAQQSSSPVRLAEAIRGAAPSPVGAGAVEAAEPIEALVRRAFARHLCMDVDALRGGSLDELGLTSHAVVNITAELARSFPSVTPTLLFEHRDLASIASALRALRPQRSNAPGAEAPSPRSGGAAAQGPDERRGPGTGYTNGAARARLVSERPVVQRAGDIAVIGMSCRYAGARSAEELWQNLVNGVSSISPAPRERWEGLVGGLARGEDRPMVGGFLTDVDRFDAGFFKISAAEAEQMDPQQRLVLEVAWEALEDSGNTRRTLGRRCGVFVGVISNDYAIHTSQLAAMGQAEYRAADYYQIANRVSYAFDLTGPSLSIDTACSSSGTALHLACAAISSGECDAAFVGGVNLILHPSRLVQYDRMKMLSRRGVCSPFGAAADGTVLGEGVGVLLLKPLEAAIAAGDPIRGVIKGSAINVGGRTNGFTVPSPSAQAEVIARALQRAGVEPWSIGYVEAHGTGTVLGDPIEMRGLCLGFEAARDPSDSRAYRCALGSVKANIGHTESGAALAGIIKVLLQFEHETLAPSLHGEPGNPNIDFEATAFRVQRSRERWHRLTAEPAGGGRRERPLRAGVSSFGAGGANFHAVLEEPPRRADSAPRERRTPVIVPLSAGTHDLLRQVAARLSTYLAALKTEDEDGALAALAYTLQVGREAMPCRWACVVSGVEALRDRLCATLDGSSDPAHGYLGRAGEHAETVQWFTQERELRDLVGSWARRGDYDKLAKLWVQGLEVDWTLLWERGAPARIHLPVRPFASERHWIRARLVREGDVVVSHDEAGAAAPIALLAPLPRPAAVDDSTLQEAAVDRVRAWLAEVTRIREDGLDPDEPFESFGIDSLMIEQLNGRIEGWTGVKDAALFFRCRCIREVARYLVKHRRDAVSSLVGASVAVAAREPAEQRSSPRAAPPGPLRVAHRGLERSERDRVDIAIVGVAGRFPKSKNMRELWQNLLEGRDCVEEIPADRWALSGFFEPNREKAIALGQSYSKWGGFLEDVDCFDPLLFNISPREAELLDPQERIFLEVAWECLEDAGYCRRTLEAAGYGNRIGVFAGTTYNNYQLLMADAARGENYLAFSQSYSIANRVSYSLNLTGPSMTVDAACASSLFAVHLACESIRSGQSTMALAGGVNLSLHPSKYIMISNRQFNSHDGRCRAFREGGSGYVPAEGVGVILLKPLPDAERDGDHIYGIVKGTALSHGGAVNGYTVPNPVSQAMAIDGALQASRIHPRTVSFIEAHGTGTALGDPIEIAGLTDVFMKDCSDTGYCSISSVKSNIGHAEAAAGMAQIAKVLLQLQHRTLVQNVAHGQGPNPNIDFSSTPFVVQEHNAAWRRPVVDGVEHPRRAGISSFGAGGANAHIVLEEYAGGDEAKEARPRDDGPAMSIVLSARTEERLRVVAANLGGHVGAHEGSGHAHLVNIAFTLAMGREPLSERLGLVARSLRELREKLDAFLGGAPVEGLAQGRAKDRRHNRVAASAADTGPDLDADGRIHAWVRGQPVDWDRAFAGLRPRRVSLPTYPFARERYWVRREPLAKASERSASPRAGLHGTNTSDLEEQRFTLELTGEEPFLRDHVVGGQRVLPGVAYLEFARDAVQRSVRSLSSELGQIRLESIVWVRPFAMASARRALHARVHPESGTRLTFEVYSEGSETVVHCQGSAVLEPYAQPPSLPLDALRARCVAGHVSADAFYAPFSAAGIEYGPAHRMAREAFLGDGELLLHVSPLEHGETHEERPLLHPGVLDAALQATVHVPGDRTNPGLPFTLAELCIHGRSAEAQWAYVRRTGSGLDITLCDGAGRALVELRGFVAREPRVGGAPRAAAPTNPRPASPAQMSLFEPVWVSQALPQDSGGARALPATRHHQVLLCGFSERMASRLPAALGGVACSGVPVASGGVDATYERCATAMLATLQRIFQDTRGTKSLLQVLIPWEGELRVLSGLTGLLQTAGLENPNFTWQLVGVHPETGEEAVASLLLDNALRAGSACIVYEAGTRLVRTFRAVEARTDAPSPWADGATYLITGGGGGLGRLFVEEIAHHARGVTLVLAGRTPPGAAPLASLGALAGKDNRVVHEAIDIGDAGQVEALIGRFGRSLPTLRGVVHAAGVLRDSYVRNKSAGELAAVFRAKVAGISHLRRATRDLPLDFFVAFSSAAGAMGNTGQADYSAANAYMDALAEHGGGPRILSIGWPLWRHGGMRVDTSVEELMASTHGLAPMDTATGMAAFREALARGSGHLLVMVGDAERIRRRVLEMPPLREPEALAPGAAPVAISPTHPVPPAQPEPGVGAEDRLRGIEQAVLQKVSDVIGVRVADLDTDGELTEYGFDSISLTDLSNRINAEWRLQISPAVFFEYTTPGDFARFLHTTYGDRLAAPKV